MAKATEKPTISPSLFGKGKNDRESLQGCFKEFPPGRGGDGNRNGYGGVGEEEGLVGWRDKQADY